MLALLSACLSLSFSTSGTCGDFDFGALPLPFASAQCSSLLCRYSTCVGQAGTGMPTRNVQLHSSMGSSIRVCSALNNRCAAPDKCPEHDIDKLRMACTAPAPVDRTSEWVHHETQRVTVGDIPCGAFAAFF